MRKHCTISPTRGPGSCSTASSPSHYTLAIIAGFIGIFTFFLVKQIQTWILFHLIAFVAVLWASFLVAQGAFLRVSAFLVIITVGVGFFAYFPCDHYQDDTKEPEPSKDVQKAT